MSYSTRSPFRTQVTVQRLLNEPGLPLAHYLPAKQIHDACRAAGYVFRNRVFNPAVTLWMFLIQVLDPDHSCRKALARFLAYLPRAAAPARKGDPPVDAAERTGLS